MTVPKRDDRVRCTLGESVLTVVRDDEGDLWVGMEDGWHFLDPQEVSWTGKRIWDNYGPMTLMVPGEQVTL